MQSVYDYPHFMEEETETREVKVNFTAHNLLPIPSAAAAGVSASS